MNNQLANIALRKIEAVIIILLLILEADIYLPPILSMITKGVSYFIVLILIITQWKNIAYVATKNILITLLVGITVVSALWSAAPEATLRESLAVLRTTMLGAYLAVRYSHKEQMYLLAWVLGITALLSLIVCILFPDVGIAFVNDKLAWQGIFNFKNNLARTMTMSVILFLLIALNNKGKHGWVAWAGLGVSVSLLLLSGGKTALILLLLLLTLLPTYKIMGRNIKQQVFFYITGVLIVGVITVFISTNLESILVEVLGKDLEFNGRMPIWTLAIEKGLERPLLGYGHVGFWSSNESNYVTSHTWLAFLPDGSRHNAHSGFLDLFLDLGLLGITLSVINLLNVTVRLVRLLNLNKNMELFWMFQYITFFLLINLTSSKSFLTPNLIWLVYVAIAISSNIQCKRVRKAPRLIATFT